MAESQKVILSAPKIIGAYSLDKDRNYINDITGLKYLKLPNLESVIDLNEGKYLDKGTEYDTLESKLSKLQDILWKSLQILLKIKELRLILFVSVELYQF